MNLQVSDIIKEVRVVLDQNQVEESIIGADLATLELDEIITQKILHAAEQILLEAPLPWIDVVTQFDYNDVTDDNGVLSVSLEGDFLRFSIAKMDDWKVPVRVAVTDLDDEYMAAQSSFEGIRPNVNRPLVAITMARPRYIEFYGSKGAGHHLTQGAYISLPAITQGKLSFPAQLEKALYYLVAAQVALTLKDTHAQSLFAMARSYMGIPEQPQAQPKK